MFPLVRVPYLRRPPRSLNRHSKYASQHRHDRRTRSRGHGTPNGPRPCGVHRGSQRHRRTRRTTGQTVWDASRSPGPPEPSSSHLYRPVDREVLMLANPHLHQAAEKLGKQMPSHFYTLQLLQRNYQIAKKAHTIYAFGILEQDHKRVKGGTGWTVQLAMDLGKPVYLFDIPSQSWYRSDHYYQVNENAATLVTGSQFVPWGPKKPTLHQSSAIVGSRDVDSSTRAEIQALFNRTFCLPENIDQLRLELEDFHL